MSEHKDYQKMLGYQQTLVSGHFVTEDLAYIAREIQLERIKAKQRLTEKTRAEIERFHQFEQSTCYKCLSGFGAVVSYIFDKIGQDWIFLFLLGTSMALFSYLMDVCVGYLLTVHATMYEEAHRIHPALGYFGWIGHSILLVMFSTYFVHTIAPTAIGSGIPEMKTVLRGVLLKDYLSFKTLVAKVFGIIAILGSGMPLGKVGSFVHISSMVGTLMVKWIKSFRDIYENDSRTNEMLSAAAAIGVACTFGSPIGGVLFSIEVTTTYFAVRDYWRGFFCAVVGALLFRLCSVWFNNDETIEALFRTSLRHDYPFDTVEFVAFVFIGIVCGLLGALYVLIHRRFVFLMRQNKKLSGFLQKHRFIYPLVVTVFVATITCPMVTGKYMGGGLPLNRAVRELFSNFSFNSENYNTYLTVEDQEIIARWNIPTIWVSLPTMMLYALLISPIAVTLPVPSGIFLPVMALGASFGRLVGEAMLHWFPNGVNSNFEGFEIVPAGYAIVAAAAMTGAATHAISTSVIFLEMTGQNTHLMPVVLAVLIANAIATLLQPSIYDSIIQIKKLPYLPNVLPADANAHKILVEDIMQKDVKTISYESTYEELRQLLTTNPSLKTVPLVENHVNMILLGSVHRVELIRLIELHLKKARKKAASASFANEKMNGRKSFFKKGKPSSLRGPSPGDSGDLKIRHKSDEQDDRASKAVSSPDGQGQSPAKSILRKKTNVVVDDKPRPKSEPSSPTATPKLGKKLVEMFKAGSKTSDRKMTDSESESSSTEPLLSGSADGRVQFDLKPLPTIPGLETIPDIEQMRWEATQLQAKINFKDCHIDAAPFQLVERTSLYKVHSIFSLLGLNTAYVTNVGRLVGVVSLKELCKAISGPSVIEATPRDNSLIKQFSPTRLTEASTVGDVNFEYEQVPQGNNERLRLLEDSSSHSQPTRI